MTSISTRIYTFFNGVYMGSDEYGQKYYQSKKTNRGFGRKHRWVIYNGLVEPTKIPPQWYCWLHYQSDEIPLNNNKRYPWEKSCIPNLSGTKYAYYPKGHILSGAKRDSATGDYEPWRPE